MQDDIGKLPGSRVGEVAEDPAALQGFRKAAVFQMPLVHRSYGHIRTYLGTVTVNQQYHRYRIQEDLPSSANIQIHPPPNPLPEYEGPPLLLAFLQNAHRHTHPKPELNVHYQPRGPSPSLRMPLCSFTDANMSSLAYTPGYATLQRILRGPALHHLHVDPAPSRFRKHCSRSRRYALDHWVKQSGRKRL